MTLAARGLLKSTNQIAPIQVQYFLSIAPGNVLNDPVRDKCVAIACKRETINSAYIKSSLVPFLC